MKLMSPFGAGVGVGGTNHKCIQHKQTSVIQKACREAQRRGPNGQPKAEETFPSRDACGHQASAQMLFLGPEEAEPPAPKPVQGEGGGGRGRLRRQGQGHPRRIQAGPGWLFPFLGLPWEAAFFPLGRFPMKSKAAAILVGEGGFNTRLTSTHLRRRRPRPQDGFTVASPHIPLTSPKATSGMAQLPPTERVRVGKSTPPSRHGCPDPSGREWAVRAVPGN